MRPLQSDPLGLGPDSNDYRWEGDGPTGAADPSGLAAPWEWTSWQDIPVINIPFVGYYWYQEAAATVDSQSIDAKVAAMREREAARANADPWHTLNAISNTGGDSSYKRIMETDPIDPNRKENWQKGLGQASVLANIAVQWDAAAGFSFVSPSSNEAFFLRSGKWVNSAGKEATAAEEAAAETALAARCSAGFKNWQEGEAYLAKLFPNGAPAKLETAAYQGAARFRYVDLLENGIAHESKVGVQQLSGTVYKEVVKDAWLVKHSPDVKGVVWHFFRSAETGQVGGTPELLQALSRNGIKYVIHK